MKTLTKEIKFGKGIAQVEVKGFVENKSSDGIDIGLEDVTLTAKVKIVAPNGKVVAEAFHADVLEYNYSNEVTFEKAGLDQSKTYSRVGKVYTEGAEVGQEINEVIENLKEELAAEFGTKTEKQEEKEEEIELAEEVVELAKKEGIENLMTKQELKAWRKRYNDINNEGGEGYIPTRVSQEQYQQALKTLRA